MDYSYLNLILNVGSVVALVAGGVIYYRSSLSANTLKLYKENQEALNSRLNTLTADLAAALLEQAAMKEELRVIKTLPLDTIMTTLNAMLKSQNTILDTQNKILRYLETTPTGSTVNITNPPK